MISVRPLKRNMFFFKLLIWRIRSLRAQTVSWPTGAAKLHCRFPVFRVSRRITTDVFRVFIQRIPSMSPTPLVRLISLRVLIFFNLWLDIAIDSQTSTTVTVSLIELQRCLVQCKPLRISGPRRWHTWNIDTYTTPQG